MPPMIVCWVSSSVRMRNVGSSWARRDSAVPSFSWSTFVLGSIAWKMTGSGNVIDLEDDRLLLVAERVAGAGVAHADRRRDVARADRVDVFAMVGVHPQDAADALLAALRAL